MRKSGQLDDPLPARPEDAGSGGTRNRIRGAVAWRAGLEPNFRKEGGSSGQKPRAGRKPGSRKFRPSHWRNAEDQLRWAHRSEGRGRRGREGASTVRGEKTRRRRSPRGARIDRGFNRSHRHRTRRGEQGPEVEGAFAGHRRVCPTARGHESAGETRYGSAVREKPLKGKPWTWLRGETNPQGWWRSKPSRACETPRTEQSPGWDFPGVCGRCQLMPR